MSTKENVLAALTGETGANKKYIAFAKKAESDGLSQIAKLFRAAAEAENVHAHALLKLSVSGCETPDCPDTVHAQAHPEKVSGVKTTKENLQEAAAGEHHEFTKMYPEFIKAAQEEKNKQAEYLFKFAMAVEKIHYGLYTEALKSVESSNDLPKADIYVCPICGNTFAAAAPGQCPICGAPKDKFISVK